MTFYVNNTLFVLSVFYIQPYIISGECHIFGVRSCLMKNAKGPKGPKGKQMA